jgi:hypothetical protein
MKHLDWQPNGCCTGHEQARITSGDCTFQINHSGTEYRVQALNAEGGMVSHPLLPDGLAIVSAEQLHGMLSKL